MNKLLKSLFGFGLIGLAFLFSSNNAGTPGGRTGAPNDGSTCGTNGGCHNTGTTNPLSFISTNIPSSGYIPGQTYSITVAPQVSGRNKYGFEIVGINSSNNEKGTFVSNSEVANMTATRATHRSTSTGGTDGRSWNVDWTAPNSGEGDITFYSAVLAANGNGQKSGDLVFTDNLVVTQSTMSSKSEIFNKTDVYPNPFTNSIKVETELPYLSLEVYSIQGTLLYSSENAKDSYDLGHLNNGMFIVIIKREDSKELIRVFKTS